MKRNFHLALDVKGVLMRGDSALRGLLNDNQGRELSVNEARAALLDELAKGHLKIPCGGSCPDFDYSGGGCPGHEVK